MLLVVVLSLVVILADYRFNLIGSVRDAMGTVLAPVQWVINAPTVIAGWTEGSLSTKEELQQEVETLRSRMLILEAKTQKLVARTAELNRLRELLNASSVVDDSVLVAEIIGINPDPYIHEIVVNKGSQDGVYVGQPVLDSTGLMGQITQVNPVNSRALLVSDNNHALPVQVNRNGVRAILVGRGNLGRLELVNVPDTADIKVGDLLESSGLGGRFPVGYPVAEVDSVVHDPGEPFAQVTAKPLAKLNQTRHILLVYRRQESDQVNRSESEETGQ